MRVGINPGTQNSSGKPEPLKVKSLLPFQSSSHWIVPVVSTDGIMTLRRFCAGLSLVVSVCALAGCESPRGLHTKPFSNTNSYEQETQYRKDYQTTRSRRAMRWLLANKVESGMSLQEVNSMLGEQGELDESAGHLKRGSGYRVDDKVYHYGPDDSGRALYLIFRDEKLVNFSPERFADSDVSSKQ